MRIESWVGAVVMCAAFSCGVAAAEPLPQPHPCGFSIIPSNVELITDISDDLQRIYEQSPTFRAQCDRIAAAKHLRVRIRINPSIPGRCRAFTIVQRRGLEIVADVHLPPSGDHSELVAHEFEHVIEQIEGLNLRRLSRVRGSGVNAVEPSVFETARAQAAGRVVATETRNARARSTD